MSVTNPEELRNLPLFNSMEIGNFEFLMQRTYVQNFPPKIELISEGEPSDFLHVVLKGSVEQFASWNRHETTMATLRPISTFILAATIKDAPYLMSARTLEKTRVALIPSSDIRDIFEKDHTFSRAVVTELAQCYRMAIKNTKDIKLRSSVERLANYLLRQRALNDNNDQFELKLEKQTLASFLNMTPENFSRAIKTLEPYGVSVHDANITITNVDDLRTLAKPDPLIDDMGY